MVGLARHVSESTNNIPPDVKASLIPNPIRPKDLKEFTQFSSKSLSALLDSYNERKEIGWGAQKKVFRALDGNGQPVALKAGKYRSPKQLERVQREVDFLATKAYPQFPKHLGFSYDVGTREFLIVEDFVNGNNLTDCKLLFRTTLEIVTLLQQCCIALQPVWNERVVHRDLKPDNILILQKNRKPVIIDFGIARFLDHSSLTASHAQQGPCTPLYAAREQLTNRKVSIDHRTDFFALGVIAAELMYGDHPFSPEVVGNGDDILENIINGDFCLPADPSVSDLRFQQLITSLIDAEPYKRPRSAESLLGEIEAIILEQ